jgi:hypothetical protein
MATQGCIEITPTHLANAEIVVPAGMTPVSAVASRHPKTAPGQTSPVLSHPVAINGTNLKIKTRDLRPGDCVCWIAYDA